MLRTPTTKYPAIRSAMGGIMRRISRNLWDLDFWSLIPFSQAINGVKCEARSANRLSDQALTNAKEQFRNDQRPYVWPAKVDPVPIKLREPIKANIFFVNYGKTPAFKQKSHGKILVLGRKDTPENTLKELDPFFDNFDESKVVGGSAVLLPPGIPPDLMKSQAYITARSEVGLADQASVSILNKQDGSFAIVGVVIYFDAAGTHYRSDYCLLHLANGALAWCEKHNQMR